MLCESCQLHFDFKKIDYTPTFIDRFELSKRLRSQGDPEFDDVRVAKYESDTVEYCSRYKSAQSDDSIDPCPWLKLDSDTINPDGSHHSSFPTHGPEIWGTVIPARSQAQITAAVDCDICLRLSYFASSKSSNYVESQLWVHIHTMRPDSILFQTRDNDETVKSMKLNLYSTRELPSTPLNPSTGDMRYFETLSGILTECANEHPGCSDSPPDDWVPSRLLDIGDEDSSLVRVVLRSEVLKSQAGQRVLYSTLSHIWGSEPFFKLSQSTIDALGEGVPGSILRQTFADAIKFTRSLGIKYLWIDSLCIIQQCHEDWAAEASQMSNVYKYGYCNIAASYSDSQQGLFYQRRPESTTSFHVMFSSGNRNQYSARFMASNHIKESCPLYTRGWVVQEIALSPRTIHFSRYPRFQCRKVLNAVDTFSDVSVDGTNSRQLPQKIPLTQSVTVLREDWQSVLCRYSNCQLTYDTDKLVALSGIAKILSPVLGKYHAGIWSDHCLEELLWCGSLREPHEHSTSKYIAPSWSWASFDGHIDGRIRASDIGKLKPLAKVQWVETILRDGDPFGQVLGGAISLHAVSFHIVDLYTYYRDGHNNQPGDIFVDLDIPITECIGIETIFISLGKVDDSIFGYLHGMLIQPVEQRLSATAHWQSNMSDFLTPETRRLYPPHIKVYRRIGIAEIKEEGIENPSASNRIAFEDWIVPPWPEHMYQQFVLI